MTGLDERLGVIFLGQMPLVVVDCQTSGAKPPEGEIIELGWQCCVGGGPCDEVRESLVALPEGARLSRRIQRLTGISGEMPAEAPQPAEVWRRFSEETRAVRLPNGAWTVVAHYARFEARFLLEWQRRFDPEGPAPLFLCTYEIARRLFPTLPKHSLRALAGSFGHPLSEARRARPQVEATVFVWQRLLEALSARGIEDTAELEAFLSEKPEKPSRIGVFYALRERRGELPDAPGVYRFINADGGTLYVGKARRLKTRVASYFQNARRKPGHIREMIAQVADFDITVLPTALEAAMLEVSEIKRLRPPYNRMLKAEEGSLVFCTPDFQEQSETPDERFTAGPFPRPEVFEVLRRLSKAAEIAQSAAEVETNTDDTPFEEVLHGTLPSELRAAFSLWPKCFGMPPPRTRRPAPPPSGSPWGRRWMRFRTRIWGRSERIGPCIECCTSRLTRPGSGNDRYYFAGWAARRRSFLPVRRTENCIASGRWESKGKYRLTARPTMGCELWWGS